MLQCALVIPLMDTCAALLSGMVIMSTVFAFGMEPGQGPGLIFATLPQMFNNFGIFWGPLFMFLFFLLIMFAALTTAISVLEVVSSFLIDSFRLDRKKAVTIMSLIGAAGGIVNVLSMSVFSDFQFGDLVLFDALNWVVDKIIIPICSLMVCIFVGHVWETENVRREITNEGTLEFKLYGIWNFLIKYAVPLMISLIMISGLINT